MCVHASSLIIRFNDIEHTCCCRNLMPMDEKCLFLLEYTAWWEMGQGSNRHDNQPSKLTWTEYIYLHIIMTVTVLTECDANVSYQWSFRLINTHSEIDLNYMKMHLCSVHHEFCFRLIFLADIVIEFCCMDKDCVDTPDKYIICLSLHISVHTLILSFSVASALSYTHTHAEMANSFHLNVQF